MTDGIWLLIGLLSAALTALAYNYLNGCSHTWEVISEDRRDWARRGTGVIVGTTITRTLRCSKCGEIKSNTTDIGITP